LASFFVELPGSPSEVPTVANKIRGVGILRSEVTELTERAPAMPHRGASGKATEVTQRNENLRPNNFLSTEIIANFGA
jgi:hypothetical protein